MSRPSRARFRPTPGRRNRTRWWACPQEGRSDGLQAQPRRLGAVNNALAGVIAGAPHRFAGFAMIHGLSRGGFVDGERHWPIFARVERLGVPVYLHPAQPDKTVTERMLFTADWPYANNS